MSGSTDPSGTVDGPNESDADVPLLAVEDLRTHFETDEGTVRAVDGMSFGVERGETVCLVGESGSGKTVTGESITRLIQSPPGEIVEGTISFQGEDLGAVSERRLREIRGGEIAHVFQNPQDALNPVYTVGKQIVEAIRLHRDESRANAKQRAIDLLDRVGIPDPAARFDAYPHELSGGMKQRVIIAIALSCQPALLIADEPTTALDVTIQAQVLDLLADLQAEFDMGVLFVTHDLGVVAGIADRVVVAYGGCVMERGPVEAIFDDPAHPYTRALLACLPGRGDATRTIGGEPPDPADPPAGCKFHPRCPYAVDACTTGEQPPVYDVDGRGYDADGLGSDVGDRESDADGRPEDRVASCVFYGLEHDRSTLETPFVEATDGTDSRDGAHSRDEADSRGSTGGDR
jgi:peptide/nickel transport system ATP-binding protein